MKTVHQLIEDYLPLANHIVYARKQKLPRHIDVQELRSAAYLALTEAAQRFDPQRGFAFSTYVFPRIHGAITDFLRSLRPMLSLDFSEEVCLGEDLESREITFDNFLEVLEDLTRNLDSQAYGILKAYFSEDETLREIGKRYGVSESRISQLIKGYKAEIRQEWTLTEFSEYLAA